jgi:uncharacterized repeat protein (TIGR03803 family)
MSCDRGKLSTHARRIAAAAILCAFLLAPRLAIAQSFEVLHSFASGRAPAVPATGLTEATDGKLYGTTYLGGANGDGTVFRVGLDGSVEVVHSFKREADGGLPLATLAQAFDGQLYGTVSLASTQVTTTPGDASSFRIAPDGTFGNVTSGYWILPTGLPLSTTWTPASDGALYLPFSWAHFGGGILRFDPGTSAISSPNLLPVNEPGVIGPLFQGSDRYLYGTTSAGGSFASGTVYRMSLDGTFTILHDFTGGPGGAGPRSIVEGADGLFYGVTQFGGAFDRGTIFRMTPEGDVTVLHHFTGGTDGGSPISGLTQAIDGTFFGTTPTGGSDDLGIIFRMTPSGDVTTVHAFEGNNSDGAAPMAGLLRASDGNFYGTTAFGGTGAGTVYRLTPAGAFSLLTSFGSVGDGALPRASLLRTNDGSLYGTTNRGGVLDFGTVFRIAPNGVFSIVHDFVDDGLDGTRPVAGLTQSADGDLYGTTYGTFETEFYGTYGTIFRMTSSGAVNLLHTFTGGADGLGPAAALLETPGGFLGTTIGGGSHGLGTIFRVTSGGTTTIVHDFAGGSTDGAQPKSALVLGSDGNFYSTTTRGGSADRGTIFRMTTQGVVTVLYSFKGGADGATPSGLFRANDGSFYGTTSANGGSNLGTAFRLGPAGAFTTLHAFGNSDGGAPQAGFIQGADGYLYGTTAGSARYAGGAVFRMTLAGGVTVVAGLSAADGANAAAALVQAADGAVYGTTQAGGSTGQGVVFRIMLQSAPSRPSTLVRAPAGAGVRLTWSSVATAVSYTVRRATASGAETVLASGLTSTQFVDANAVPGQTNYYVVSAVNALGESLPSYEVSIHAGRAVAGDFSGDQRTDITVFRPSTSTWYLRGVATIRWGGEGDIPVHGDFDGDGIADIAVFRQSNGTWYIINSSSGAGVAFTFGRWGDIPVPSDYDGDGITDLAVFRPTTGTWFIVPSGHPGPPLSVVFGGWGDVPVPGDYDGDGKTDLGVFRPSTGGWHVALSTTAYTTSISKLLGGVADIPAPGDYDGDGKTDMALFSPATNLWTIVQTSTGASGTVRWGGPGDVPVPGDYDGDGRTDIALFRPATSTWYIIHSGSGAGTTAVWGGIGDVPPLSRP